MLKTSYVAAAAVDVADAAAAVANAADDSSATAAAPPYCDHRLRSVHHLRRPIRTGSSGPCSHLAERAAQTAQRLCYSMWTAVRSWAHRCRHSRWADRARFCVLNTHTTWKHMSSEF